MNEAKFTELNLLLYTTDDCVYCRQLSTTLAQIAQERPHIIVTKIAYNPQLHTSIKATPSVIVQYNNDELGRFSSALSKKSLDSWLDQLQDYIRSHLSC